MKKLAVRTTEHPRGPLLLVKEVRIGRDQIHKRHFVSIFLKEEPGVDTIRKVADLLQRDFTEKGGPFMQREFVGNEIHLYPSPLSEVYFHTREAAIKEYRRILRVVLRLGRKWYRTMQLDGSLLPFEQRMAT